ncbi:MAG: response regulator transcription factor [SAR324 cluster bacterium]|nr:response regulator transcription factor [SAR324 cluster bacterium]
MTNREKQICLYLAYGYTNAEISAALHISERTVEGHRSNIMEKLGIKSRAELVHYAIKHGIMNLNNQNFLITPEKPVD